MSGPAALTRNAVVLSGGGAHGAYEIGVMKALFADGTLAPDAYTGTSVGAFNAAFLVSETNGGRSARQAVARLEALWTGRIAGNSYRNGVYRVRADPRPFLDLRCFAEDPGERLQDAARDAIHFARQGADRLTHFLTGEGSWEERAARFADLSDYLSTAPFRDLVRSTLDTEQIGRGPTQLRVAATSLVTGEVRIFANPDLTGDCGHDAVIASGSIPIVFPPHPVDGELFVDGAVRMNTPLTPAAEAAATSERDRIVLHTIVLDPGVRHTPIPMPHNTLSMFDRLYGMLMSNAALRDIATAARINDALYLRGVVEPVTAAEAAAAPEDGPSEPTSAGGAIRRLTHRVRHDDSQALTRSGRVLTIHHYRPDEPLSGALGLLDFSAENVARLIEQGQADAQGHDCVRNACVLARD